MMACWLAGTLMLCGDLRIVVMMLSIELGVAFEQGSRGPAATLV